MRDVLYAFGDNEFNDGNYLTGPGAYPKAARLLISEYCEIDGVGFGNRMYTELARSNDTSENREIAKRCCEAALAPLVATGEIRDLVITVDASSNDPKAQGIKAAFWDAIAGQSAEVITMPPWSRV
jgi:hypothetical protein